MIAPGRPGEPSWLGRVWNVLYEGGYASLRAVVMYAWRPLFGTRRVGTPPRLPRGSFVLCANHASYLDPAFVQLVLPRRVVFLMTYDFYRRRAGRWFFKLVGAIPVDTGRLARKGLERAVALLREGQPVALFPEGRLSTDGSLATGQRGVAILSRLGHAPVVPVGIAGNLVAWPKGARRPRRADVRVAFGPPIPSPTGPSTGREAEQDFADRVMAAVERAVAVARKAGRQARTRMSPDPGLAVHHSRRGGR